MTSNAIAVIPARIGSTRFPRKLLAAQTGKPLIWHVVEQVKKAKLVSQVIVATDHEDIQKAVESSGVRVEMTRADHPNGTSRIAEVVARLNVSASQIVVNVQGDEPEIEPAIIDMLVTALQQDTQAPMGTIASAFAADEDASNPNIVKVVLNVKNQALYFSRSLIPFDRDKKGSVAPLKHLGIYAYRRDFLLKYVTLPATPLEQMEQLEQLRALEHGYPIAVVQASARHHGIDTAEQYAEFVKRYLKR